MEEREKIYVNFEIPDNIPEFLKKLFAKKHDNILRNIATYKDPECKEIQCPEARFRSFDDIYNIILTYFPETSVKELLHYLITVDIIFPDSGREGYLVIINCYDIYKPTFYYGIFPEFDLFNPINQELLDRREEKWKSEYNWIDLFALLNITNKKEIVEYKKNNKGKIFVKSELVENE